MKIALCLSKHVESAAQTVSKMLEAQRHEPNCTTRILPFAFGSIGLLGRPDEDVSDWPFWEGVDGSFLVFAGVPIVNSGASPGQLSGTNPAVKAALSPGEAERVFGALSEVDGAFVGIWWSASRQELTVLTDFLGMQPLYRAATSDMTCFASELQAFTRAGVLAVEADAGAWASMLYIGHHLGERTMLDGATRVPPANAIAFSSPFDASVRETWRWPVRAIHRRTSLAPELGDALRADIRAYAAAYPDAALLLSGGFDSRIILALCHALGLRPQLRTQSHSDENADADARFGEAFARALGMRTKRFNARADFYGTTDYLRFLTLNEVAMPSLSLFIASVSPVVTPERHGIWEGLILDPAFKFDYQLDCFAPYLNSRFGGNRRAYGEGVHTLFRAPWAEEMDAGYDARLAGECARFSDDAEGIWQFSVMNRTRLRHGTNPYQVFDTSTPPLTPGMSKRFWELAASAEPEARMGKRLYREVFAHVAPRALDLPVASGATLIPGNKGALLYQMQRVRIAIQTLARRPKVRRQLRALGLPAFEWEPSRYLELPPNEAEFDDPRLNADWLRQQESGSEPAPGNQRAREIFMYWRAWHHVMRGDLVSAWE